MTVDVCEEFCSQKPGNSDVISVIMSRPASRCAVTRAKARLLVAGRDQFKTSFVARRVLRCVRDPTDGTATYDRALSFSIAGRRGAAALRGPFIAADLVGWPSAHRSPLSKHRLSVQLCRVTSTSHISHIVASALASLSFPPSPGYSSFYPRSRDRPSVLVRRPTPGHPSTGCCTRTVGNWHWR